MFETPFYHELIKKTVIGFGALFSQVKVLRPNPNDVNATAQVVAVPIAFGPKEKTLARVDQDPSLTGHTYITLPRMAFEVTGYNYDPSRMTSRNNKIQCYKDNVVTAVYTPVPYNIEFSLYVLTKGTEDGLGIIEQILPTFTPEYTLTVNAVPELNISQDIPIILNSVSVSDDYEGDFATRRLVTHTLNFTAKINLFGNISTGGVILRTDTDIKKFENHTAVMDADGNIIVDSWRNVNRETLNGDLVGTASIETSTQATLYHLIYMTAETLSSGMTSFAFIDIGNNLSASTNITVNAEATITVT